MRTYAFWIVVFGGLTMLTPNGVVWIIACNVIWFALVWTNRKRKENGLDSLADAFYRNIGIR